jgi:hypothetical protein
MDPWLEGVDVWHGVHARLITRSSDLLQPQLRELGFFVDVEERVYIEESERHVVPDLAVIERPAPRREPENVAVLEADEPLLVHTFTQPEIRERFLQIFDSKGRQLVTQIEYISHTNKNLKRGRNQYIQKRDELQAAGVNVVEIDLLRGGTPIVDLPDSALAGIKPWDYLVNAVRAGAAEREAYRISLRGKLPRVRVPLRGGLPDAVLDIQAVFNQVYDAGPYPDRIDYTTSPVPPLSTDDDAWADKILRSAGLRTAAGD